MKSINILVAITLLPLFSAISQINNAKTENIKIFGNCGMCETKIEKAGNLKKTAHIDWDKETKNAKIVYDTLKTDLNEILKRIAIAGYDSNEFLAPDEKYQHLPDCCKYKRSNKQTVKVVKSTDININHNSSTTTNKEVVGTLNPVFNNYFNIKEALVNSDASLALTNAESFISSIKAVEMEKLTNKEQVIWLKVMQNLIDYADQITLTKDIQQQREYFIDLSNKMYELIKSTKHEFSIFYQFCPMANNGKGANWLSKDESIKNPFYGSQMISCGKTIETIK
ncbi:DUF3347 domain-containing protein [Myroides sp. JBRI-B21084]|uniref:DUF3347 domain-containing protein n=1 Tax=Myroides sp. JBRI-B21084 TaxID=3119977 RepID=UPI0026E44DC9|nr:DUF3347 domain-containing protein [Paenimyroides cloacae]WKW47392.1 DUF3347 domain-containing protein [Paenimyroides cloacae]